MALDTEAKRRSALQVGGLWRVGPVPDTGAVDREDKLHLLGLYADLGNASIALTGASASASAGSLIPGAIFTLPGASAAASAGSLSATIVSVVSLTGLASTVVIGSPIIIPGAVALSLLGVVNTSLVGIPSVATNVPATSKTFGFDLEYADIISEAYERCGLNPIVITPSETRSALRSINLILAEWTLHGVNLFTVEQQSLPLEAGTTMYELPAGTVDVLECALRRRSVDHPVERTSRDVYMGLVNKTTQSLPTRFWVDRQYTPVLHLWMAPKADDTLVYYRSRQPYDASAMAQTPDVPHRWLEPLCAALAVSIAVKKAPEKALALKALALESYQAAMTEDAERGLIGLDMAASAK